MTAECVCAHDFHSVRTENSDRCVPCTQYRSAVCIQISVLCVRSEQNRGWVIKLGTAKMLLNFNFESIKVSNDQDLVQSEQNGNRTKELFV